MLTPAFELSQDDEFITLIVQARYAKVSETEVLVDGKIVKFYSKPYFLRLTLPGALLEDGRESAQYDASKGIFTIRIPKETQGERFDGLDMLTRLMAPTGQVSAAEPSIEPIAFEGAITVEEDAAEDINWEVEQTPCLLDEDNIIGPVTYGFAGRRSGVFSRLQDELSTIVDVPEPDQTKPAERRKLRWQEEQDKFDDEHYLADLYQDEMIQPLLVFKPPWEAIEEKESSDLVKFSDEEQEKMRKLPRKEFILDAAMEKEAYMGLVDIIFAFAFNHRCTEGENSVESAWTICKLSATLSWLDTYSSLRDVVVSSVRRSLCYPLYRHWGLAQTVLHDVKTIFSLGRNQVLKALLAVHSLLAEDDPHYILNELYITDYCVWIQGQSHQRITTLADSLKKITIVKSDVDLDLDELEAAASSVLEEEGGDEGAASTAVMRGYPQLLQEPTRKDDVTSSSKPPMSSKLPSEGSSGGKDQQSSDSSDSDVSDSTEDDGSTSEESDEDSGVSEPDNDKEEKNNVCNSREGDLKQTDLSKAGGMLDHDTVDDQNFPLEQNRGSSFEKLETGQSAKELETSHLADQLHVYSRNLNIDNNHEESQSGNCNDSDVTGLGAEMEMLRLSQKIDERTVDTSDSDVSDSTEDEGSTSEESDEGSGVSEPDNDKEEKNNVCNSRQGDLKQTDLSKTGGTLDHDTVDDQNFPLEQNRGSSFEKLETGHSAEELETSHVAEKLHHVHSRNLNIDNNHEESQSGNCNDSDVTGLGAEIEMLRLSQKIDERTVDTRASKNGVSSVNKELEYVRDEQTETQSEACRSNTEKAVYSKMDESDSTTQKCKRVEQRSLEIGSEFEETHVNGAGVLSGKMASLMIQQSKVIENLDGLDSDDDSDAAVT